MYGSAGDWKLRALAEKDGSVAWESPGVGNPTIAQDKLLSTSYDAATGKYSLYLIDSVNGKLIRDYKFNEPYSSLFSVDDKSIYFVGEKAVKIDATTGGLQWKNEIPSNITGHMRFSSNSQFITGFNDTNLFIINKATGGVDSKTPSGLDTRGSRLPFVTVTDEKSVFSSSFNYGGSDLGKFSLPSKAKIWNVKSQFQTPPVLADGSIYVVNGASQFMESVALEARSHDTGELLWSTVLNAPDARDAPNPPKYNILAVGNWVFVSSDKADGFTYAINRTNHQVEWKYPVTGELRFSESGMLYINSFTMKTDANTGRVESIPTLFAINLR